MFPVVAFAQQPWYKYSPMDYSWQDVGNAGFSAGEAWYESLAFNPSDSLPYVAFQDNANSNKATVMKFDGDNWVNVGNAGFSADRADNTSLAFSPSNNQPYVAYEDWGNSEKATVMMFNGTNWVNVGDAGFSAGEASCESLAFSPSNKQPYVAFTDALYGPSFSYVTVTEFNGTNWVYVGHEDFSDAPVYYTSLAFSHSGQPYVAYSDGIPAQASVMEFDGTNWIYVGSKGFSAEKAECESLAFSPSGEPFVAYVDFANSMKATVMYYDAPVGINKIQETRLSLYPNPATDIITIETSATQAQCQLSILNLSGQELITRQITQPKTQIDVSALPSGVYFVRLTNERTVEVGKIVKE